MDWRAVRLARDIVRSVTVLLAGPAVLAMFMASPYFLGFLVHFVLVSFPEPNAARIFFRLHPNPSGEGAECQTNTPCDTLMFVIQTVCGTHICQRVCYNPSPGVLL